jgi:hypothetical protein
MSRKLVMLLISFAGLMLFVSCSQSTTTAPDTITFSLETSPGLIINNSKDEIGVIQPVRLFIQGEYGWEEMLYPMMDVIYPSEYTKKTVWIAPNEETNELPGPDIICTNKPCEYLAIRRYFKKK